MEKRGNFAVYTNRSKQAGDKRPLFQGTITAPETDHAYSVAVWGSTASNGKLAFYGRSERYANNADAASQISDMIAADAPAETTVDASGLSLEPTQLVLFANGFKDADHPNRPDYWGRWNPGAGQPVLAVSAWLRKDRYQRPMLAGQVSAVIRSEEIARDEKDEASLDTLVETGKVTTADKVGKKRSRKSPER